MLRKDLLDCFRYVNSLFVEVIVIINVLVEFKDYVCVCGFIVVIGWVFVFGKVVGIMYGLFLGFGFLG